MRWGALGLAVARGRVDLGKKIAVEDEKGKKATIGKAFPLFFSMNRRKRGLGFPLRGFPPFRRRRNLKEKSPVVNPWKVLKEQGGGTGAIESFEGDDPVVFPLFFRSTIWKAGAGAGAIETFGGLLPFRNPLCN
ncbi:hypothetical protein AAC387_Pa08g1557 [Persea americana]